MRYIDFVKKFVIYEEYIISETSIYMEKVLLYETIRKPKGTFGRV